MKNGTDTDRENVETSRVADDFVVSKSGTKSHLYAGKLVLSYPVWKGELEAGTEMTFVNRNNTYWIDKALIANTDADITENNIAAFAEYSCDFAVPLSVCVMSIHFWNTMMPTHKLKNLQTQKLIICIALWTNGSQRPPIRYRWARCRRPCLTV